MPKHVTDKEFINPSNKFRGAPFWSWNDKMSADMLVEQIDYFKQMGFGGFHIHPRTGLKTEYLGREYMECVRVCVNKAEAEGMMVYLYDEDRWPSGFAGGLVTKNKDFRAKHLLFTPFSYEEYPKRKIEPNFSVSNFRTGNGKLIACYDIVLDSEGFLLSYDLMSKSDKPKGVKWYAYLETAMKSPWFNNFTNVDVLNKDAIDEFIKCTHEKYHDEFGEYFGGLIPSIFTDEPQTAFKSSLCFATDKADLIMPWTTDFAQTFADAYNKDIIKHLPQLVWELPGSEVSYIRYCYYDHISEKFTVSFAENIRKWCAQHNIKLTGHTVSEGVLQAQSDSLGDVMRIYRGFDLPGVDILHDALDFSIIKPAQSVSHQYGCNGLTGELYGVTNWDFDFRGHKFQGDWAAALGITFRAHHLSMYSMAGEAKRDYPASLNYQSPWYKEYKLLEDHYSRINTQMTKGTPVVNIGVINPIESFWLYNGSNDLTGQKRAQISNDYKSLINWLLLGTLDFDFISEALLKDNTNVTGEYLQVGEMRYQTILVPRCETIRDTTYDILLDFIRAGGKVLFLGDVPKRINCKQAVLTDCLKVVPFTEKDVLDNLEDEREITIVGDNGKITDNLLYSLRDDGQNRYLFIAHGKRSDKDLSVKQNIAIELSGHYIPLLMNTFTGEAEEVEYKYSNEKTVIRTSLYNYDSILLKLSKGKRACGFVRAAETTEWKSITVPKLVEYKLSEPNVLLLDTAEFALDGEDYLPQDNILRADNKCRKRLGLPLRMDVLTQPWAVPLSDYNHSIKLRFSFESDIEYHGALLAMEEDADIIFNGNKAGDSIGYYVDKAIKTVNIGTIKKGENVLVVEMPFGELTNIENFYILGNFGVTVMGAYKKITKLPEKIGFSDITYQGMSFYGGSITYIVDFIASGQVGIKIPRYRGALVSTDIDNVKKSHIIFPPYEWTTQISDAKTHTLNITVFGNRMNTFGSLHYANDSNAFASHPNLWRTEGGLWTDSYKLKPFGLLVPPVLQYR